MVDAGSWDAEGSWKSTYFLSDVWMVGWSVWHLRREGGGTLRTWMLAKWLESCFKEIVTVVSIVMVPAKPVEVWSKTCLPQSKRCELGTCSEHDSLTSITSLPPPRISHQVNWILLRLTPRYNLNCHNFEANERCTVSDFATQRTMLYSRWKPGSCYLLGVLLRNRGSDFLNFLGVFLVW